VDRLAAGNLEPRCGPAIDSRPRRSPPSSASAAWPTIPLTARTVAPPRSCSPCTPGFAPSGKPLIVPCFWLLRVPDPLSGSMARPGATGYWTTRPPRAVVRRGDSTG